MGIWNRIRKNIKKGTITSVPLPTSNTQPGLSNPQPSGNKMSMVDAQSWAPDIHPNGRESSSYIQDVDYDNGSMDVTFRNGTTVNIQNVKPDEVKDFIKSSSKGRYYNRVFADRPYKEI